MQLKLHQKRSLEIHCLYIYLKDLEKDTNPKKEKVNNKKVRAEINELENGKVIKTKKLVL